MSKETDAQAYENNNIDEEMPVHKKSSKKAKKADELSAESLGEEIDGTPDDTEGAKEPLSGIKDEQEMLTGAGKEEIKVEEQFNDTESTAEPIAESIDYTDAVMEELESELSSDGRGDSTQNDAMEDVYVDMLAEEKKLEDILNTLRKRRTHMADKAQRRKLYKEEGKIIHDSGTDKALTLAETRKKEAHELMEAARCVPAKILTGILDGVQVTQNGIVLATVTTKGTKGTIIVKIPSTELFPYKKGEYEGNYLRDEISSRINSEIPFVVYDVVEAEGYAIASRLRAMEIMSYLQFVKERGTEKIPRIIDGMKVPARVVGIRKDRLRVEVAGVETTIRSGRELSWTALSDLRDEYKMGQKFYVVVSNIKFMDFETLSGKKRKIIQLSASRSAAEPNPAEIYYDQFNIGDVCAGTIKAESGEAGVFVTLKDKMDALCMIPVKGSPVAGAKCTVLITNKNDEKKQITGRILQMN